MTLTYVYAGTNFITFDERYVADQLAAYGVSLTTEVSARTSFVVVSSSVKNFYPNEAIQRALQLNVLVLPEESFGDVLAKMYPNVRLRRPRRQGGGGGERQKISHRRPKHCSDARAVGSTGLQPDAKRSRERGVAPFGECQSFATNTRQSGGVMYISHGHVSILSE